MVAIASCGQIRDATQLQRQEQQPASPRLDPGSDPLWDQAKNQADGSRDCSSADRPDRGGRRPERGVHPRRLPAPPEALTAVIALADEVLLHQAPCQPAPLVHLIPFRLGQVLTQAAQVNATALIELFQHLGRLIGPVRPAGGLAAAIAATAGGHELTHGEQQSLLAAAGTLGNRLHPPQLLLGEFRPGAVLGVTGFLS